QILVEQKHALAIVLADFAEDVDALAVGSGYKQAWFDGMLEAVLGGEHDDVAGGHAVAAIPPSPASAGDGGGAALDLGFANAGNPGHELLRAARDMAFPHPIHRTRDDIGGADQLVSRWRRRGVRRAGALEQRFLGTASVDPVRDVTFFRQLGEVNN